MIFLIYYAMLQLRVKYRSFFVHVKAIIFVGILS